MIPRLVLIFATALLLNILWEHLHSVLYVEYRGGEITSLILFRAAFFDALIITIFSAVFLGVSFFRKRLWLVALCAVVFAIVLERYALVSGRWTYADTMPLLPFIHVGLSPAIQLGLLTYVSVVLTGFVCGDRSS